MEECEVGRWWKKKERKDLGHLALGGTLGRVTDCIPACILSHALGGIFSALGVNMLLAW